MTNAERIALSRPATPAAGDAEVERVVAWLRASGESLYADYDGGAVPYLIADAIERGDHLGETS